MELYKEILCKELGRTIFEYCCDAQGNCVERVNVKAIDALQRIKTVIEDDSLSDFDCIEKIVCVFEEIGSDGGNRHD